MDYFHHVFSLPRGKLTCGSNGLIPQNMFFAWNVKHADPAGCYFWSCFTFKKAWDLLQFSDFDFGWVTFLYCIVAKCRYAEKSSKTHWFLIFRWTVIYRKTLANLGAWLGPRSNRKRVDPHLGWDTTLIWRLWEEHGLLRKNFQVPKYEKSMLCKNYSQVSLSFPKPPQCSLRNL